MADKCFSLFYSRSHTNMFYFGLKEIKWDAWRLRETRFCCLKLEPGKFSGAYIFILKSHSHANMCHLGLTRKHVSFRPDRYCFFAVLGFILQLLEKWHSDISDFWVQLWNFGVQFCYGGTSWCTVKIMGYSQIYKSYRHDVSV